ncbi:MAG: class I SAM-dependent methyltransferase [Balneolaceae bacterium]
MIPSNIKSYYKLHSNFYDLTRWAFLFGRNSLPKYFPKLEKRARILDLGCGTGKQLVTLRSRYPEAELIGIDLSEEMLAKARSKLDKSIQLKNEIYSGKSFKKNSFDLVVASYSLTMFTDIEVTIQAIKTHLKPSGILLVVDFDSTPFSWFRKWMKKNHVSIELNLFGLLKKEFLGSKLIAKQAYFGLYSYLAFIAKNKKTN